MCILTMSTDLNPWHSRPIDVHRWSDHPEVVAIVDQIWEAHFPEHADPDRKTGPRPKTPFKNQLRVVVLDLYVAWSDDPTLCIGVPMSANGWNTNSRYNAIHLSKAIIPIVQRLHEVGLIELAGGSYSGPFAKGNRNTRIRASEQLQERFRTATMTRYDIGRVENQECIILKQGEEPGDASKLVEYEDTGETNRMRAELTAYNDLLSRSFIDIPSLEEPFVEMPVTKGPETGTTRRVSVGPDHKFTRRIFSRGDWGLNGRFYGGWWQQIGSDLREEIFINDTPTVEVDFQGLHVAILSLERGIKLEDDPYELPEGTIAGVPAILQRQLIKQLVLIAINAGNKGSAFSSFRDGFPQGHVAKTLTNNQLEHFLSAFTKKHPQLEDKLCSDQGIRLMYVDSCIAELVHAHFTAQSIPVLSVHDSYIIDYTRDAELKEAMATASQKVVGVPLATTANGIGLDSFVDGPPDRLQDFIEWLDRPRCKGYLARLTAHKDRLRVGL